MTSDWLPNFEHVQSESLVAVTHGRMLQRSLKIPYHQGALMTRSSYKKDWYAKTFPYEEGPLKRYAKNFLRDVQGWICWRCCQMFFS